MEGEKERGREREVKKGAGEGEKGGGEQGVREGGKKKKYIYKLPINRPCLPLLVVEVIHNGEIPIGNSQRRVPNLGFPP